MDTGGDAGLGGSRGSGRRTLRKKYVPLPGGSAGVSGGGGGGGGVRRAREAGAGGGATPTVLPIVTSSMQDAGVLDEVFTAHELLYYLKQMARFIQKVADGGAEGAAEAFGVQTDSLFSTLQRRIRRGAPGNAVSGEEGTDSHQRALTAFQVGSSKWAKYLTKAKDIVVVTVNHVALVVSRNVDESLVSSPYAILEEYIDLVVASFLAGEFAHLIDGARKEYRKKLKDFLAQHDEPSQWVEAAIDRTMASFPKALL